MRIGFDCSPLVRAYPPGVQRACRGLLNALRQSTQLEVVSVAPDAGENERLWRHLRLPREIGRGELQGVHSPISAFPARGPGRRVSTVHELPWRNGVSENAGASHRFWAHYGVGRADAVLCPTEFVRQQLIEQCGGGANIVSCPWGQEVTPELTAAQADAALQGLGLGDVPFALAVGATRDKKNLRGMLQALVLLHAQSTSAPLHLVITGNSTVALERDLALASELGLRAFVHATGHVSELELRALHSRACLALVLAHSEGFGFPALEALQHGTPLVVTQGSAQAEVAGPCAVPADSRCARSIARAMRSALLSSSSGAAQSRLRAEQFSWERSARTVEQVWMQWA